MQNAMSVCSDKNNYYLFITVLRTLATCLITNTHLGSIYPKGLSFLAVGGLLGDALFFAVSGFCLVNSVNGGFFKWYGKRILRIYPTVLIISVICCLIGEYQITSFYDFVRVFIYPTRFHFIASIMLLYIFFFFVLKLTFLKNNLPLLMSVLGVIWLAVYVFAFDKTGRLDTAEQPITKFLFFECMLFGAYVAINKDKFINNKSVLYRVGFFLSIVLYLATKITVDRLGLNNWQFLIIITVFLVSVSSLTAFSGLEELISKHNTIRKTVSFIAPLTLEIYVVQHLIISRIKDISVLVFPLNFISVIALILFCAILLNRIVKYILKPIMRMIKSA